MVRRLPNRCSHRTSRLWALALMNFLLFLLVKEFGEFLKFGVVNLKSSNGLLFWGGRSAYDAGDEKVC